MTRGSKGGAGHSLFEEMPLNAAVVDSLRRVLTQPDLQRHIDVIDGLLALHADPSMPMPPCVAEFADVCGFYPAVYQTKGLPSLLVATEKAFVLRDINVWLLKHAEAAGFLRVSGPETTEKGI